MPHSNPASTISRLISPSSVGIDAPTLLHDSGHHLGDQQQHEDDGHESEQLGQIAQADIGLDVARAHVCDRIRVEATRLTSPRPFRCATAGPASSAVSGLMIILRFRPNGHDSPVRRCE